MRTVKWLKEQLSKYPDDALCYAYEGEVRGVVVVKTDRTHGFIPCSEDIDEKRNEDRAGFAARDGSPE